MTEPTAQVAALAPTARTGSRRRIVLALSLAALLLSALTAWQLTARNYTLAAGEAGSAPPSAVEQVLGVRSEYVIPLDGGSHQFRIPITNPGPAPVTLTEVGSRFEVAPPMFPVERMDVVRWHDGCCAPADKVAFGPTVIHPDETVFVYITVRTAAVSSVGGCQRRWFASILVKFTVLGLQREQTLSLKRTISYQTPGADCRF
ncbi:hypothetical protein Cs7R123_23450 [Catellatospora sp. TT07R-123]|uniref:hypothetical protein n=1 Tax=Catellatospora sp. TT07R-123 TaxID=2733863 RepID=UPI001B1A9047|nr:hypothetical protein [Catellatospora sp. TT07R-123]GHJ45003.1 hypothetical protein Cs7R123_23450 [Catellatospora sp. TT07R-123]